ncbi:Lst7p ASCRUDRAFT_112330 [Ascoidea rubescens DSM 1968]|uniref:Folliculin/SMCR8 longin domain-containing protein n=1 Tax=Ascoidea rubescens DSM 1968 TaxID=1344418 RepID=A0A1D2VD64_9ASCO|nr:hypothetical protein ASCRUDRAFT_112330 [Ascoidea rubescens DSM 1968]ODV59407.1 hypothetical protein ASCRUDRAFT_112330 [Ascoidea rubescens DSM 1968]
MEPDTNYIFMLSHFCELHGPKIIMVTHSFHVPDAVNAASNNDPRLYNQIINFKELQNIYTNHTSYCNSCKFKVSDDNNNICLTNDKSLNANRVFLSSQLPKSFFLQKKLNQLNKKLIHQENINSNDPKLIIIGNSNFFYSITLKFKINEFQSRGQIKNYQISLISNNFNNLLVNYNLIFKKLNQLIYNLCQKRAYFENEKIFKKNGSSSTLKYLKNKNLFLYNNYDLNTNNKNGFNLTEIVDDNDIFIKIHKFASILLNDLYKSDLRMSIISKNNKNNKSNENNNDNNDNNDNNKDNGSYSYYKDLDNLLFNSK